MLRLVATTLHGRGPVRQYRAVDRLIPMVHHDGMINAAPAIAYENVGKSFEQGRTRAVDDVSLNVAT